MRRSRTGGGLKETCLKRSGGEPADEEMDTPHPLAPSLLEGRGGIVVNPAFASDPLTGVSICDGDRPGKITRGETP